MFCEPLRGRCWVDITQRRTRTDWAHQIKELVNERYPQAEQIVLVTDNLSTHTPASLYEAFDPAEARRLAEKFGIHYTPKHGSWLNVAEIELSALSRQCFDRRVADFERHQAEVAASQERHDEKGGKIDWRSWVRMMHALSSSDCTLHYRSNSVLRGSVKRRVVHVSRHDGKAVESLEELSSIKSCQPIDGSSKTILKALSAMSPPPQLRVPLEQVFSGRGLYLYVY